MMEFLKLPICILVIIGVTTVQSQGTSLSRASFGEACSRSNRCDSRSALACTENVCQCVKPDEMVYDKNKGKCVVLSGERCSYTAVEIVVDQTQEKRWNERLDCVDNAVCNNDGYCDCSSAYYEDVEGSCSSKQLHGQNCTKDNECRKDKNLICVDGICSCNQTEAVFDPAYKICVARAGSSCIQYERCVRNANCPRRGGSYYGGGSHNYDSDSCTCSREYKQSKTGFCLAKHGMSCDAKSAPCTEDFSCTNGKCECHFPYQQIYTNSRCVSYVRGPCLEQIENNTLQFTCVSKAECKNLNGLPECLCEDGYIESEQRKCDLAHGSQCGTVSSETCDKVANLVCKSGKCACPDFQIYDATKSKCRGLVGATCTLNENAKDFCVEGANCESYRDTALQQGVCRCVPPFVPNSSRKCSSLKLIEKINLIDVSNGTVESMEDIEILAMADSTST